MSFGYERLNPPQCKLLRVVHEVIYGTPILMRTTETSTNGPRSPRSCHKTDKKSRQISVYSRIPANSNSQENVIETYSSSLRGFELADGKRLPKTTSTAESGFEFE